jgi:hypothetical protein
VDRKLTESAAKKATRASEDAFSLPPAVKTPHDKDGPPRDPNAPSGSLSSDDEEVVPVDFSIGIKAG